MKCFGALNSAETRTGDFSFFAVNFFVVTLKILAYVDKGYRKDDQPQHIANLCNVYASLLVSHVAEAHFTPRALRKHYLYLLYKHKGSIMKCSVTALEQKIHNLQIQKDRLIQKQALIFYKKCQEILHEDFSSELALYILKDIWTNKTNAQVQEWRKRTALFCESGNPKPSKTSSSNPPAHQPPSDESA